MTKGTALVGFLLSFLAGTGLMWGIDRARDPGLAPIPSGTPASAVHASSPIPIHADDPTWGKADAPVTIVAISDFECPFCSRVVPTLARVEKEYGPDRVRIVWKNNPLSSHANARPAAEAAATVQALGGDFWKFHDLAFSHQKELTAEHYVEWAVAAGVDASRFRAALGEKRYAAKVDRDLALASQLRVRGTPHFLINGKALGGAQPFDKFKQLIDGELGAADALGKAGVARAQLSLELTRKNFALPRPTEEKPPAAAPVDNTVWRVPVSPDDPAVGPADALVTIVEFSDFQCPFCSRAAETLERLRQEYPTDLRVIWKDMPMTFHPRARPAALLSRFAYAKRGDEGFWAAHEKLFANQKNLDDAALERVSGELGLDWREASAAMSTAAYRAKLDQSLELAADFTIPGTPHFFINGRRLSGARPYEDFKRKVDAELTVAQALVNQGKSRGEVFREIMKTAQGAPEPERKNVPSPTRANPSRGPATAKVTIVEFSDFQCPFCSRASTTVEQVLAAYPKDVRLVWRHLPLPMHDDAGLAAEAAQEAFAQRGSDGFWKYHDTLFQNQKALQRPDLERYARDLGLDVDRFKAALDSHAHEPQVEADRDAAKKASIGATPGFVINGYFVSGAQPFDAFDRLIKRALKGS